MVVIILYPDFEFAIWYAVAVCSLL